MAVINPNLHFIDKFLRVTLEVLEQVIDTLSAEFNIDVIQVCPQTCKPFSLLSNAHFLQDQSQPWTP